LIETPSLEGASPVRILLPGKGHLSIDELELVVPQLQLNPEAVSRELKLRARAAEAAARALQRVDPATLQKPVVSMAELYRSESPDPFLIVEPPPNTLRTGIRLLIPSLVEGWRMVRK